MMVDDLVQDGDEWVTRGVYHSRRAVRYAEKATRMANISLVAAGIAVAIAVVNLIW